MRASKVAAFALASRFGLASLRALALVRAGYFALSWLAGALYETPRRSAQAAAARYLLLNLHTALVPLCLGLAAITAAREFLALEAGPMGCLRGAPPATGTLTGAPGRVQDFTS